MGQSVTPSPSFACCRNYLVLLLHSILSFSLADNRSLRCASSLSGRRRWYNSSAPSPCSGKDQSSIPVKAIIICREGVKMIANVSWFCSKGGRRRGALCLSSAHFTEQTSSRRLKELSELVARKGEQARRRLPSKALQISERDTPAGAKVEKRREKEGTTRATSTEIRPKHYRTLHRPKQQSLMECTSKALLGIRQIEKSVPNRTQMCSTKKDRFTTKIAISLKPYSLTRNQSCIIR